MTNQTLVQEQESKEHEFIVVKSSSIHNNGVFAKKFIPKNTKIIEYLGEKITKEESDKRSDMEMERAKSNPDVCGSVYIFELDEQFDIDGNVSYNDAKYMNHSCEPNCDFEIKDGHIWIHAIRDINKGEEISYNYGYDFDDDYKEHPCRCMSQKCVGYILAEEHWEKLKSVC